MICDLAETYHILNYKELPPEMVATLVIGLREDSRVKLKLSNNKVSSDKLILASICDSLQFLCWTKTKDAQHNKNRPKPLLSKLLSDNKNKEELKSFKTVEEYEAYMASIT